MKFSWIGSRDVGIDLGTANVIVTVKGRGIVVNEPSVVAIDRRTEKVVAVGHEAKEMLGRTPEQIRALNPIVDGVIADFTATQIMVEYLLHKISSKYNIGKPRVIVSVPARITEVEERAVEEAIIGAGAREVYLVENPIAAAIGENLNISEPTGNMILDIGAGLTEIAVISLGGIVISESMKTAGDEIDEYIIEYVKRAEGLVIGKTTAEKIKIELGCSIPPIENESMIIRGRDLSSGLPIDKEIFSSDIEKAMRPAIAQIVELVRTTMEKTPPELVSDIMSNGLVITGGGALIKDIDRVLSQTIDIPVYISKKPLECVAYGTEKVTENIDKLRSTLISKRKRY